MLRHVSPVFASSFCIWEVGLHILVLAKLAWVGVGQEAREGDC